MIIQFGYNDGGPLNDDSRARGSLRGSDEETHDIDNLLNQQHETVPCGWYLRKHTHTTLAGAELNAAAVIAALKTLPHNPVAAYLSPAARNVSVESWCLKRRPLPIDTGVRYNSYYSSSILAPSLHTERFARTTK